MKFLLESGKAGERLPAVSQHAFWAGARAKLHQL